MNYIYLIKTENKRVNYILQLLTSTQQIKEVLVSSRLEGMSEVYPTMVLCEVYRYIYAVL